MSEHMLHTDMSRREMGERIADFLISIFNP